jgi:hypothetical protein
MSWRKVTLLTLAVVCFVGVGAFGALKFKTWRQSRQITREIAWIHEAVRQIQKSPGPAPELIQTAVTGRWETARSRTEGYLIFSNDWAACRTHSVHADDSMDDIAILKAPNGGFYLSGYHMCMGIEAATVTKRDKIPDDTGSGESVYGFRDHSQPANAKDFLENGAKWQGWYQFSRDGKLQCIVRSPHQDHRLSAKSLWVWIGAVTETNSAMLFEKRYSIASGRDMTWTANWASDSEITLDVFDYAGNSPTMMGHDFPKRLLVTLIFQRDQQSGKFTERTNILRYIPITE